MDGRGRPAHVLRLQDRRPPLSGRGPPPVATYHPADNPLSARRLPIHPSALALEDRLAAQYREIQVLLLDNQQLAASHVDLKNDLNASQHELRLVAASVAKVKAERDAEVREVYERSLKADAEVRAIEGMRAELVQVRSDVQRFGVVKDELVEQLQTLKGVLVKARAENQQAATVSADVEVMRKEIQKGRAAIEFEKKAHADNLEQSQIMENNLVLMAREIENLRAELVNTEKRAQAAAAAANPGYAITYENPEMIYGANSYAGAYIVQQQKLLASIKERAADYLLFKCMRKVTQITADGSPQFGGEVTHGQYGIQQTHSHR